MAVLRPVVMPTLGIPQQVIASSRRGKTMADPTFYQQQMQQQAQMQQEQRNPQFDQAPQTGEYLMQQIQQFRDRKAYPMLEPGARVVEANMDLVGPNNFGDFYDRLGLITDRGVQMTGTAAANAAHKKAKAMAALMAQQTQAPNKISLQPGGGGGQNFGNGVPSNPAANFQFAQNIAPNYGWSGPELNAWYTLGMKESGWRNNAQNPTSTAYGIGQFLNSTWGSYGIPKTSDPGMQVEAMARYIKARYGSPSRALAFHISHNWY